MDNKLKKIITVIVLIFLFIIALKILGWVLGLIFPLLILGIIGYVIFRLINRNGARRY